MRASDIRKGQAVIIDGKLMVVTNADHNTPGNLRAKVQFKLRDVAKGTIQDKRVGATDDIETTTSTPARSSTSTPTTTATS
jgi:translation elongation factor P/translation initiation factor 5A